jgi:D-alanyl-D-alanine carboxypeptidase/D-alanyl-D-alanine carboxypeptidase (penicillin-binding protein 5/6)
MKRWISLLLALSVGLCFRVFVSAVPATARTLPTVSAQSAILINAENGAVYFEKLPDQPMGMASTTKLMTALVVSEHCKPEEVVTVSPEAVGIEGSSVYLIQGEQLTVKELLYALLLSSANDAAAALAIWVADSVDAFCDLMNERAERMGLTQTHFTNPHGLHDEEHYTTARELAKIAAEVLKVPFLRQIVSTVRQTISHDGIPDRRLLLNHNKLLRSYEGAIGMKTGFTKKTGRTLVSAAERDGLTLIAVTLNAPDDWRDHTAMLDYGFNHYETVTLAVGEFCLSIPVTGGTQDSVSLTNSQPLTVTVPKEHGEPIYTVSSTGRFLFACVEEQTAFGTVTLSCEGQKACSPLVTTHAVRSRTPTRQSPLERLLNFFRVE